MIPELRRRSRRVAKDFLSKRNYTLSRVGINDPASCFRRALIGEGQLSFREMNELGRLVATSDFSRPIVEIGTLFGASTLAISLRKNPEQRLITVDNYCWNPFGLSRDTHLEITTARLSGLVDFGVEQVYLDKERFFETYVGPPPAVVFLDADHSYTETRKDIDWALSIGASVVCGDDYSPTSFPGVVAAVADFGGPSYVIDELFVIDVRFGAHTDVK